jgi:hypothetical protein
MIKKNHRFYLLLFLIFASLISSCNQENTSEGDLTQNSKNLITEDLALKISSNILFKQNAATSKNAAPSKRKVKNLKPVKYKNEENLFYIVNYEDGGFVILSADNRLFPILAYSDTSVFRTDSNDYSSGLVGWLSATSDTIRSLRKSNIVQSVSVKKEWNSFYTKRLVESDNPINNKEKGRSITKRNIPVDPNACEDEYEQVGPLTSTIWHQRCGFNDFMPALNCSDQTCGKARAGCVPIAIAQVMKYHKFPTTYNWDNMPPNYGTTTTASLIKDIHNSIGSNNINYKCDATSVPSSYNVATVFTKFNYSSASYGDYNYETVKQQLRLNKPVILSGGPKQNFLFFAYKGDGHMWVCDGFRRSHFCTFKEDGTLSTAASHLYLSMNWGWGDYENGWYAFNNFNPAGENYNFKVKMVYNIAP